MASNNVAGQGPLLGWNNAQDAISALTRTINDLNKGLKGVNTGVGQMSRSRGLGLALGDVWNGSSNYGQGRSNGGQSQVFSPTGNGGGARFSSTGSQGGGAANNGGQGGGNGGSGTYAPRMGGGAGNNGGHRSTGGGGLKKTASSIVSWGQKILPDQVMMQTSAYQASQGSSMSWHTLRDQAFKSNYTAQSTQDAATAYGTLAQTGMSAGSSNFSTNWNYVKSSGYINPGMSQTQRAAGAAAAWNAPSYYGAQAIGVQTIKSGKKQSPRQIAQQVFKQFNLDRVKDPKQIAGTIDNPNSGLMMTLSATFDASTVQDVQAELRGMALSQQHGGSMQAYVSTANKAQNGNKDAVSQLKDWKIGDSSAQKLMTRAGTLRNQDVAENDAFTAGLSTATKYLDQFSTALQGVLKSTGLTSVMGSAGGAGSLLGSSLGAGVGTWGAIRGLGGLTRLGGRLLGGAGAGAGSGAGAGAGGAAAAGGGVSAGMLGAGVLTGGAAAALGWKQAGSEKNHSTLGSSLMHGAMALGGPLPQIGLTGNSARRVWDKFKGSNNESWGSLLNPFGHESSHSTGSDGTQGGAASGSSSVAASGSGKSGQVATGTTGAGKTAAAVIAIAMKYLGTPYKWGGSTPKSGFDCSGLIQYSFKQIGVSLPRTAAQQQKSGTPVKLTAVRAGDLLFNGNPAHHVVMCIGNGRIIEAPHTGANVRVRAFKPGEFTNAVRILGSVGNLGDVSNGDIENQAGSSDSRLSTMGFGGDVGSYGSVEEVDAIASGVSAVGAGSLGSGVGAGQKDSSNSATSANGAASGAMPTGSLKNWIKTALGILKQDTTANEKYVNTMAMHESGGNPKAINNWDSNAKAGHPSKGLLQTIDSTFNAYSLKGHKNIWNPVDNIIAGVRYADSRYGSLANVPGIKSMNNGGAYKGYAVGSTNVDVDQTARVHKGEMIIPAYQAEAMRNVLAGNNPMAKVGGANSKGGAATLQFNAGAITVKVQGAMDAQSARDAAQQFISAVAEDDRINLIAAGN